MSKLRFYAAMLVAKTMYLGLKLLGRNASYLPGKAAVKICKDFLACRCKIIKHLYLMQVFST